MQADAKEPKEAPKDGCYSRTLVILVILGCIAYLFITGEKAIPLRCDAKPHAAHAR